MKKLVTMIIALALVLSLTACAKEADTDNQAGTAAVSDNTTDTTATSDAADTTASSDNTVDTADVDPAASTGTSMIVSPITEYSSLEELNDTYKVVLVRPAVMGVTEESFVGINMGEDVPGIAQYSFDLNGLSYNFRSSSVTTDISGYYVGEGTIFEGIEGESVQCLEGVKAARWFTIDGQYCLCVTDEENVMDEETFNGIVEGLKTATLNLYGGAGESNE